MVLPGGRPCAGRGFVGQVLRLLPLRLRKFQPHVTYSLQSIRLIGSDSSTHPEEWRLVRCTVRLEGSQPHFAPKWFTAQRTCKRYRYSRIQVSHTAFWRRIPPDMDVGLLLTLPGNHAMQASADSTRQGW